jgi:effector-binding domain-containing protein
VFATPQIVHTTDQLTAALHLTVPTTEIQNVMGPGIHEVLAAVAVQGLTPTGPWFTHHFRRPTDTFDFEICIPVSAPITASGRVKPGQWPGMTVARVVYQGGYEGLPGAWGEFHEWIAANGHKPASDLWERYLVGPESGPDPANWQTELNQPLVG